MLHCWAGCGEDIPYREAVWLDAEGKPDPVNGAPYHPECAKAKLKEVS